MSVSNIRKTSRSITQIDLIFNMQLGPIKIKFRNNEIMNNNSKIKIKLMRVSAEVGKHKY